MSTVLILVQENLAVQRVQLISPYIRIALVYGTLDPQSNAEPLKVKTHTNAKTLTDW